MATFTVRNVKETTKRALQHRAVRNGMSMEEQIRVILDEVAESESASVSCEAENESLYDAIRRLVEPDGGFELEIPERQPAREPPTFD